MKTAKRRGRPPKAAITKQVKQVELRERLLKAQQRLANGLAQSQLEGEFLGAVRQALHEQGVLCRRESWEVTGLADGHCLVQSMFTLQSEGESESRVVPMICGVDQLQAALSVTWELWLRDLMMLPKLGTPQVVQSVQQPARIGVRT